MQTWSLWYPKAGATGLLFARGRIDPTATLLVHAAPDILTVEVFDSDGQPIARGVDLGRSQESPMTRLTLSGSEVHREDAWPAESDLGLPVLLPGGEAGILQAWWNAQDRKEWRWQIELYNSIR